MSISSRRADALTSRVCAVRLFALFLLLLLAGEFGQTQAAGIGLVQHAGKDGGTTTSTTLAFPNSNTGGNFIAVVIRGGLSKTQVFTVNDSLGNTYKQAAQIGSNGSAVTSAIYYAENIKAGANTVTVSMTVSGPLRLAILEYSGVATSGSLDATAVNTTTSTAPSSGTLTTTASGDLLLAMVATADSDTFATGTGYAVRDFVPAEPNTKLISEDQVQAAAGPASATATLSVSSNWGTILAAFKPVTGGGGSGTPASITATAGTPQSAVINAAFATQLQATVKDSSNNPVSGATVTFAAPGSGASGAFAGGVTTASTNASGIATAAVFTANTTAGAYTVTASVAGVSTSATFSMANLAGPPASITSTGGTPQSATVNSAFAVQLQATVKDSFSNPVSGATVTFAAPGSGASGAFTGGVNTAMTNASGVATAAVFTANTTPGAYTVSASVSGVASPANYSLTNLAGAAANITATAGTPQNANINTAFAVPLQATVKDSFSNPVSGATVTFAAPGSGASGTFAGSVNTATTNATGVATAAGFTANSTAGSYTVAATVSGAASAANFSLTNLVPPPSISALNPTSGPVGTSVTITGTNFGASQGTSTVTFNGTTAGATSWSNTILVVQVPSGATTGNVVVTVGGVQSNGVAFTITLAPVISSLTPASGSVGAPVIISGSGFGFAPGSNTVTFNGTPATVTTQGPMQINVTVPAGATTGNVIVTTGGLASNPVNFTVTVISVSVAPATVSVPLGGSTGYRATVQNDVPNQGVTWSLSGAGCSGATCGSFSSPSSPYTIAYNAPSVLPNPPTVTLTATSIADPTKSATSAITLTIAPSSITATAGTPQSAPINTAFSTQLQATVKDSLNNPVSGVTVTFATPVSGASGTFAGGVNTATTDASGVATAPVFTANSTAGGPYIVAASVAGVSTPANFSLTNLAGPPAGITATAGTPQNATINTAFATQLQATVKDSSNNPVSGATVTFAVPGSGASGTFSGGVNTATTNASGVAMAPVFTANNTAGSYTVTASVTGVSTPVNFSLTNLSNAPAKITLVQHTGKDGGTTTSTTMAFPSSNTAGNFIAVVIRGGLSNSQVFTVRDSVGNTYKQAAQIGSNGSAVTSAIYYAENIKAGANTVTVSMTVSGPLRSAILEYSGVATSGSLDITAINTATSTAPNSGTLTTTANGDLLLAMVATADSDTFAAGTGYTVRDFVPAAPNTKLISEDQVQTAAGPVSATASMTVSSNWGAILAAFKAATGGGGSGTPASITATAGTPQSAVINAAFATQLQATVKDSSNNPVSGVTVTFAAPGNGASGTFAGGVTTATTNASGVATAAVFTANSTAGAYTLTASISGVSSPANFSLTNLATASPNIALVQHKNIDSAPTNSNALAFTTNTTAGNWIAVCIRGGLSNSQVFTVSDSSGNTYHQAFRFGPTVNPATIALYYAENIKGGPDTINVTQSVFAPLRFAILEYSGVALSNSLDGTPVTAQGQSANPNSGSLTTSANGDLLLATIETQNNAAFTAGTGYAIEESVPASPNTRLIAEDQLQRAAGSISAGASLAAADNWGAGLAAFRSMSGIISPISVSLSPAVVSLSSGYGTQAFTATVTNDFLNQGVTWSLSGAGCSGSACGTLSRVTTTSATYTAPPNIPNPATVTLTATSVGDATKSASAVATVTQGVLTIVVSPKRAAVTVSSSPVQFTSNVYNDPSNSGVTWQVDGNFGGNSISGTVSATGLYTPGTQPGQHTVTATSNANASVGGSAFIALTDLAGVYTHHNDNARTGQNLKEYALTPATVNSTTFGQLFSCPVDGFVYAQPLWVAGLNFGGTTRNVVIVATQHNSVYAFDADSPSCVQLWRTNFLATGVTTLTPADVQANTDIVPEIGITSTPVIDPSTNTVYVVPKTRETVGTVSGQACSTNTPCYVHRLHALDLITGAEKFGGPVVIAAPNFTPLKQLQRPALLLANNTLYLAFGSHGDQCPYQGWVIAYNPATLAQIFANSLSDSSSGCNQGAIWQSGAGPAADASGNVYVVTGNGLYDGTLNFGDSVVKLSPTGSVLDWFTPFDQGILAANDVDLGSAGVLILPDSVGSTAHPHLALIAGKISILYLLDQNNMGKFNSSTNSDVQEVVPVPPPNTTLNDGGNYAVPAYWNGNLYTVGQNFPLSQFQISNGVISTPQAAVSNNLFPPRGGVPAVSANGTAGGIVWIIDYTGWQNNTPSILDAYDANNVGTLLFSGPGSGAGAAGAGVKWSVPTVANGKVYIGTQFFLNVYGLLPN